MDRTITLENVRTASDVTMPTRLKDGGVAIDWTTLTDIKAWLYSDAQRAMAGRCTLSIDESAPDVLVCEYSALKPQYPGVNRLIVQAKYMGRVKTYDKPVLNFVPRTAQVAGEQVVLVDPIVNVEIEVEDVTSSILDSILAACVKATEEAREIVDASRGPRGFSAYEVACQNGFEGTEQEWLASLVGPAGKSAYQLAVDQGYEGTLAEWLASLKGPAGDSAYQIAVEEGFVGTKAQWLASLVGPQGLSAYQVAVVEGFEGSVSDWLASLVGPPGDPGITDVSVSVDNNHGTPSATATIVNKLLQLAFHNLKGDPGQSAYALAVALGYTGTEAEWIESLHGAPGAGIFTFSSQQDGTVTIVLTNGDTVTVDLNHNHVQYYSKEAETEQPVGGFLPDVIYKLGTLTGTVVFAIAAAVSGNANHYFWIFSTGSTAPDITWPASVVSWGGNCIDENTGNPVIAASKRYEVSLMDGVAYISES